MATETKIPAGIPTVMKNEEKHLPELDEPEVRLNDDFSSVIVVDNVPVVTREKYEKLQGVMRKFFQTYGTIREMHIPLEGKGDAAQTTGFAFFEYTTSDEADAAVAQADGKKLDKQHTLRVNSYADFQKYGEISEKFELKLDDLAVNVDMKSWLLDADSREQYVTRYGPETEIWWNDPYKSKNENGRVLQNGGQAHKKAGKTWTESYCAWSPKGSYLATFHNLGIVLWGGPDFDKIGRFPHPGVKFIDFSPNENYLITCNMQEKVKETDPECIIVWDIRTQKKLRGFEGFSAADAQARAEDKSDAPQAPQWPVFKWSHDDKYIARLGKDKEKVDQISVFQVPEMGLLDKKSIKVPGARDVQWSPTANILSYWVPEKDNVPAKVSLVETPSRNPLRDLHLYSVQDIKLYWQNRGDYLCVKVTKLKTKKQIATTFEVFRMREKDIPVEVTEIDGNVGAFAWEPSGHRFATVVAPPGQEKNATVSFFSLKKKKKIELLHALPARTCNALFWSPHGSHIVLAGLAPLEGLLEFYDVDMADTVATGDHYQCVDVEWDPSGRYVMTSVTQPIVTSGSWKFSMEKGYRVFAFDGKGEPCFTPTTQQILDALYQAMWRPRPATLLSKDQLAQIRTNLREKYWKKFELEDEKVKKQYVGEAEQKKYAMKEEWRAYRSERQREYKDEAGARTDLRRGYSSDDESAYEMVEELVETELSEEMQIVSEEEVIQSLGAEALGLDGGKETAED